MRPDRLHRANPRFNHPVAAALFTAALLSGCANPGPPKPPSLHLPAIVKDLAAERVGDQVLLRWTTPSRTTDDLDIKGPLTAQLCRAVGDRPLTPAARAAACAPVRRLSVTPGPSQAADTLPPALQADPTLLLTYRVQIFNAAGRSAGDSAGAFTAAGPAPPAIASLRAAAGERGAILEWPAAAAGGFIDLTRVDISPLPPASAAPRQTRPSAAPARGKTKAARTPPQPQQQSELHLRAATAASESSGTSGTVDTTAVMGSTYTYTAQLVRTVTLGGRQLEIRSAPSAPVTLAMRDTFPPRPPAGLAAISGTLTPASASSTENAAYIDLSWEPSPETDLAGYRVYRQLTRPDGSPQGPIARLAELPAAAPAYRDIAVRPGQGYSYTVTAVDAAGNESAPSAKALETIPPDAGRPPL